MEKLLILLTSCITDRKAMQFARSFEEMDDETALKIMAILGKKEELD